MPRASQENTPISSPAASARSPASNPKLVVPGEPTSSIDVFSQAQIPELIKNLRKHFQLTNILVSHDLGAVAVHEAANKTAIMYLGKIVDFGPVPEDVPERVPALMRATSCISGIKMKPSSNGRTSSISSLYPT